MGSYFIMVVGIVVVLSLTVISVPSSAQQNGACLEEILTCLANAGAQGYPPAAVKPCCPALTNAVTKDKSCFCLMEPGFTSQGAESEAIFNGVLSTCGISGTMSSICFVPPEEPCLKEILPCLANAGAQNYPPAAVKLCCPAITNAVAKDKSCFCSLQPGFATQGADAESIFNGVLGTCGISSTMNSICSGNSPSTSSGSPSTPANATSSTVSRNPITPTGTPSTPATSNSSNSATHKVATTTSISGLFMMLMLFLMV